MGIDSFKEMRKFVFIDHPHPAIQAIFLRARIGDICQTIGQFQKRCIGGLADTSIVAVVGSFSTRASFFIVNA